MNMSNLSPEKQAQISELIAMLESMNDSGSEDEVLDDFDDFDDSDDFDEEELEREFEDFLEQEEIEDFHRQAYESTENEEQINPERVYRRNTTKLGKRIIKYSRPKMKADWKFDFIDSLGESDCMNNLEMLSEEITQGVFRAFGNSSRISTIYVDSGMLIVNNVCYAPDLDFPEDVIRGFPMDTWGYLESGCLAYFFDWGYLEHLHGLRVLAFDDSNFVLTCVADGVGLGRKFGISSLFRICPDLQELYIEGEQVGCDGKPIYNNNSKVNRKMNRNIRLNNILDGFNLDIYGGTNGLQNFFANSTMDYIRNRGNKNLFRYGMGVVARAGATAGAFGLNLGTHVVGGTLKTIGSLMKDAFDYGMKN